MQPIVRRVSSETTESSKSNKMNYERIADAVGNVKDSLRGGGGGGGNESAEQNGVGGMMENAKQLLPDVSNLYVQPLDPASDMTLADRASLIQQSARPWREFFDLSNFNLPPLGQLRGRVGYNVVTYFYNYFLLTCLHLFIFAFAHFGSVIALVAWMALAFYLWIAHPDDIQVSDNFALTKNVKVAVLVVTGVLALTVGHVFTLVISLLFFVLIVVGIHSVIRDDTADSAEMGV